MSGRLRGQKELAIQDWERGKRENNDQDAPKVHLRSVVLFKVKAVVMGFSFSNSVQLLGFRLKMKVNSVYPTLSILYPTASNM